MVFFTPTIPKLVGASFGIVHWQWTLREAGSLSYVHLKISRGRYEFSGNFIRNNSSVL